MHIFAVVVLPLIYTNDDNAYNYIHTEEQVRQGKEIWIMMCLCQLPGCDDRTIFIQDVYRWRNWVKAPGFHCICSYNCL